MNDVTIGIVIVDDHQMFRDGLRLALDRADRFEVLAEAGDGRAALQLVRQLDPDVVLMDVTMPDLNGIDAVQRVRAAGARCHILSLSMHTEANPLESLSLREREILQLLVEGHSTVDIAEKVLLSPKTVHAHRQKIMTKLGVDNLPALTKYALREGLISLD